MHPNATLNPIGRDAMIMKSRGEIIIAAEKQHCENTGASMEEFADTWKKFVIVDSAQDEIVRQFAIMPRNTDKQQIFIMMARMNRRSPAVFHDCAMYQLSAFSPPLQSNYITFMRNCSLAAERLVMAPLVQAKFPKNTFSHVRDILGDTEQARKARYPNSIPTGCIVEACNYLHAGIEMSANMLAPVGHGGIRFQPQEVPLFKDFKNILCENVKERCKSADKARAQRMLANKSIATVLLPAPCKPLWDSMTVVQRKLYKSPYDEEQAAILIAHDEEEEEKHPQQNAQEEHSSAFGAAPKDLNLDGTVSSVDEQEESLEPAAKRQKITSGPMKTHSFSASLKN